MPVFRWAARFSAMTMAVLTELSISTIEIATAQIGGQHLMVKASSVGPSWSLINGSLSLFATTKPPKQ